MESDKKGRKAFVVERMRKKMMMKKMEALVVVFVVWVGFQERKLVVVLEEQRFLGIVVGEGHGGGVERWRKQKVTTI